MDIFEWSRRLILSPMLTFALQNVLTGITPAQATAQVKHAPVSWTIWHREAKL